MTKRNKSKNRWALGLAVGIAIGVAGSLAYNLYSNHNEPVTAPPAQEDPVKQPDPQPEPAQPGDKPATDTPQPSEPPAQQPPAEQPNTGSTITFPGYTGSGSLPLQDRKLVNNAFQIERLDWSESSRTLTISGKMRIFEAVGFMRVRDENKQIVEPERVVRAPEGAPAWSPIQVEMALDPANRGKRLFVEFYARSPKDGSIVDLLQVEIKPE